MEALITTTTILKLNEQEKKWLKTLIKNTIDISYEEESVESRQMRQIFWNALDKKR